MRLAHLAFCATFCCLALTGCTNRYLVPATTFQTETTQTINVLSDFYKSRNDYEEELYLTTVAADPAAKVAGVDAQGNPTPLGKQVFTPASIKARLDALTVISTYATRLYALANTSAPGDFSKAATAVGTQYLSLSSTFHTLANDPSQGDGTAESYVGPITSLVGALGQMYLNDKRDAMVQSAIKDGAPNVRKILLLIQSDMDKIFSAEVVTGANQRLDDLIKAYNKADKTSWDFDRRMAFLEEIKGAKDAAAAAAASTPANLVGAMLTASDALAASADPHQSKAQKVTSLAQLNDALSGWIAQIQRLATAIKPLA